MDLSTLYYERSEDTSIKLYCVYVAKVDVLIYGFDFAINIVF